jgi:hypothetical protein
MGLEKSIIGALVAQIPVLLVSDAITNSKNCGLLGSNSTNPANIVQKYYLGGCFFLQKEQIRDRGHLHTPNSGISALPFIVVGVSAVQR